MKKHITLIFILLSLFGHYVLAEKLNINSATSIEITKSLKGIGETKAEAIITYREEHGPFKTEEDLLKVKGIGQKTLDNIRIHLLKDSKNQELLAQ